MDATSVSGSSATLNATVDPNGKPVSACSFEYGTTTAYGSSAPCTPAPGEGESAVAVAAQLSGLHPHTTYHFRIAATNEGGSAFGEDQTFQSSESLPERGRCLAAPIEHGAQHGGYTNSNCTSASEARTGAFEWTPGAGASRLTLSGGALTLETAHAGKIACTHLAGSGEFTGAKSELLHFTLTGCEQPGRGTCQDEDASSGEIALAPLEGELGTISKANSETKPPSTGTALRPTAGKSEVAVLECGSGASAQKVLVEGSLIGAVGALDKMSSSLTLTFSAKKGKQKPEAFEGGAPDVLLASFGAGSAERVGLSATVSASSEEPLEIKALD